MKNYDILKRRLINRESYYKHRESRLLKDRLRYNEFKESNSELVCKFFFRRKKLWKDYRLIYIEYLRLLINQSYSCAICQCAFNPSAKNTLVHIDHDHITGEVRGLLCNNCNTLLGRCKDSTAILKEAVRYLNKETRG